MKGPSGFNVLNPGDPSVVVLGGSGFQGLISAVLFQREDLTSTAILASPRTTLSCVAPLWFGWSWGYE